MDAGLSRAVRETFVRLYEEGLIYQDDYIVNWCPRCQTVLSDLEVEREERDGEFVYIKYGPLTLGTVRPETKLGDTGLAVHPKDKRYKKYVGKTLDIPSVDGNIRVKVAAVNGQRVRLGITAPPSVPVSRLELLAGCSEGARPLAAGRNSSSQDRGSASTESRHEP